MKWQPWIDYRSNETALPIDEPPCKHCEYWYPVRVFNSRGRFDGVTLCHSPNMESDFSCFREQKKEPARVSI